MRKRRSSTVCLCVEKSVERRCSISFCSSALLSGENDFNLFKWREKDSFVVDNVVSLFSVVIVLGILR